MASHRPSVSLRRGGTREPIRPASQGPGGPVAICRLRVPLPDSAWISRFSQLHPEVCIEALSRFDIGPRRSLTEIRLQVPPSDSWAAELRSLPQVTEVEELEGGPSGIHLRVTHHTAELVPIFRQLRLMHRFPFRIRAGVAYWVVVAPEPRIRRLLSRLQEKVPAAVLESVRHTDPTRAAGPLTSRQTDVLRRAMAAGYFEVPRKVTLTGLAKNLGMAASSLSESLAIVEKKLLEQWPISDELRAEAPGTVSD